MLFTSALKHYGECMEAEMKLSGILYQNEYSFKLLWKKEILFTPQVSFEFQPVSILLVDTFENIHV